MWTFVIAFTEDMNGFMMVRSIKRGGWEMPGGRAIEGETPLEASVREFREETGYELISRSEWSTPLGKGFVQFGYIGNGDERRRCMEEISEVGIFERLPQDLAYPLAEYEPMLSFARSHLMKAASEDRT